MAWLNRINPTPAFPAHTGPYKVGSIDVEIPTSELDSPSADPAPTDLPTVAFRVFYPCKLDSDQKGVKWIPSPQREYIASYAKFLGANSAFAGVFSLLPQVLYYVSMPVHKNAELHEPSTKSNRWPVMIFSHGLGGSRNAYSHICGSLASHGVVVVAPDHRDGSAPLSIHHTSEHKDRHVGYRSISHNPSTEVYEARDDQLRIRLWEMGIVHDALLKLDEGRRFKNVAHNRLKKGEKDMLAMFANSLNVHEPGAMNFAGHSFGACTVVQFLKSVYYRTSAPETGYQPLFTPSEKSNLIRQITPANSVVLLDLWTLPIQSPNTAWLRSKPMPSYDAPGGGKNIIAILSEAFFKWSSNYKEVQHILAKPSTSQSKQPGPHIFYPVSSAHLSQSDFGVLFPWVTTKVFGAKEPDRVLRLNTRAILQVLRDNGAEVGNTSAQDLEINDSKHKDTNIAQDTTILSKTKDSVRGWVYLGSDVGGRSDLTSNDQTEGESFVGAPMERVGSGGAGPGEAMLEGEVFGQAVEGNQK